MVRWSEEELKEFQRKLADAKPGKCIVMPHNTPPPCVSVAPTGELCDLPMGHTGLHQRTGETGHVAMWASIGTKVEGRAVPVRQERVVVPDPEYAEKPKKRTRGPSELELLFGRQIADLHPEREWKFHPERRWRFDFAWPGQGLAVEIDGGQWTNGRHNRGSHSDRENEKNNTAQLLGWRVLHFTGSAVKSGEAERVTREALK